MDQIDCNYCILIDGRDQQKHTLFIRQAKLRVDLQNTVK